MSNTITFIKYPSFLSSKHRYFYFSLRIIFRRISDWFLKHIYHFQWILEESFDDFCTIIPIFIIKYPLVLWLSLLDEFLEEFMNYFFTQILITFIKYQSLALLCFLDELLEEFLNDHFLEEFLEDFLDDFWSRVSRL